MLFGRRTEIDPLKENLTDQFLHERAMFFGGLGQTPEDPQQRKAQVLKRLEDVATRIVWTFHDEACGSKIFVFSPELQGLTTVERSKDQEHPWFISMTLHVNPLRVLLNQKATPAERSIARLNFAIVVSNTRSGLALRNVI